jgi:acetyl-CoA carboxylase carboxyltransferase component
MPPELVYGDNLWASAGIASYADGIVTWNGAVSASEDVVVRFDASVDAGIISPTTIVNTATIADGLGHTWQRQAYIYVLGISVFLPLVRH